MTRFAMFVAFLACSITCVGVARAPDRPFRGLTAASGQYDRATPGEYFAGHDEARVSRPTWPIARRPVWPGEFQPVEYLLIGWNDDLARFLLDIIEASWNQADLVIMVPRGIPFAEVEDHLRMRGLRPADVRLIHGPIESPWIRDYGPLTVQYHSERALIDLPYFARTAEDHVPEVFSRELWWDWHWDELTIRLEGGNLLSDGRGRCFTTAGYRRPGVDVYESLLEEYAEELIDPAELTRQLRRVLGCRDVFILPPLRDEATRHVDMYMTVTNHGQALVGEYEIEDDPLNALRLDAIASTLQRRGVAVTRIPMPARDDGLFRTYTNALAVNDVVLVPVYPEADRHEARALAIFERAYPDRLIVPIVSTEAIELQGAVHCTTMTIASLLTR